MRYSQTCPVIFGEGAVNDLGSEAGKLGISKAVVITDEIISKGEGYKACIKSLKDAGIGVVEFTGCLADPPSDVVHEAAKIAKGASVNGVIGIGGGSCLDTAKGMNVLFNNPEPITQYFGKPPATPGYPLICVPTAGGTGSEVTGFGVLTNSQTGVKGPAVFSPASLAVLDPVLTVSAPPSITATTGMDAFSHAAEAMTSMAENPMSDLLAFEAIRLIAKSLPAAFDDGSDMQARTDLLLASNFAGIAFNDSMIHIGHAIAHSAGVQLHYPHGLGCALAMPVTMKYSAISKPDKVKAIGQAMGLSFDQNETPDQIGDKVSEACISLMKRVKIPSFKERGESRDDILGLIDLVMTDVGFVFLPSPLTREEVLDILGALYDDYQ